MQCSLEEIERKRQQALQKLASKKILRTQSEGNTANTNAPFQKQTFKFKSNGVKINNKTTAIPSATNKIITGKCVLEDESNFSIELSGYSSPAIEIFRTIPSRNFDMSTKKWSFNLRDYELLVEKLSYLKGHLVVEKFPKFVLQCLRKPQRDLSRIDLNCIDPALRESLMPFQKEGVCYGIDKLGRVLIADDMGLGKTFQALGIASFYRKDWPLLIVTTASMKNTWEETIQKYLPSVPLTQIQYMIAMKDYIYEALILIVSHDMFTRSINKLLERNFGVVIIDESHNFKNFKAKGTQAAIKLTKTAKRVILLSGTPALSRPSELFSQLSFIDERFFGNFIEFSKRYCDGKSTQFGWDASGQSNLKELKIILTRKFMIRRTKDQVLSCIPNKSQEVITLDVNLNQFNEIDRKCLTSLSEKYHAKKGNEKHAALLTFFSETAKIKIPSVVSYILQLLETKEKFLVFAHHQVMLDAIQKILRQKHLDFIRIDGNTSSELRKNAIDSFQNKESCICAILSITAANAGITLTAATLVIFAELHWNPSILSQAESRAHRIGQEMPVRIRYLIAPGTADDSIWPLLQKKQKILNEAGLCKESYDNVGMSAQTNCKEVKLTEDIEYKTQHRTLDISSYFETKTPPCKKQKINDSVVSDLNASLVEDGLDISGILNGFDEDNQVEQKRGSINVEEMFNDGLDDVFSSIEF